MENERNPWDVLEEENIANAEKTAAKKRRAAIKKSALSMFADTKLSCSQPLPIMPFTSYLFTTLSTILPSVSITIMLWSSLMNVSTV